MRKFRLILYAILLPLLLVFLYFVGVIGYAMVTDYQPEPQTPLTLYSEGSKTVASDTLAFISWNIGYAGLGAESDFFYDGGKTVRMPKPVVEKNLAGIENLLKEWRDQVDGFLLQEVDRSSKRSWELDEFARIQSLLPGFSSAFAVNYQVGYVPVPFVEPMGKVNGGLASFLRFSPTSSVRHAFEGNYDFPTYLFFLDRCFLVQRVPTADGKELVLINTHNSAYDDGTLKQAQMEQLKAVLLAEYEQGNYVIVGGDWNQYPPQFAGHPGFEVERTEDNARFFVPEDYPAAGWTWAWDPEVPTNRQLRQAWNPETTPRVVIDYFLLSPNVNLVEIRGLAEDFAYSDHNPVFLQVQIGEPPAAAPADEPELP